MPRSSRTAGPLTSVSGREPALHRWAEGATQVLLFGLVLFSPWALGATVPWAVRTMNIAGFALGGLLGLKEWVRWRHGFRRPQWQDAAPRWAARILGVLTVLILAWCLVSAVNARSAGDPAGPGLEAGGGYVSWLPHSRDGHSTWRAFWLYLGLAGVFWAARDWLSGLTPREARALGGRGLEEALGAGHLPRRLRSLLWVLCVNTALVAAVALFQRLEGTDKLLWLVTDPVGKADRHFGPFPYRNNGAAFVNLVWPVGFGLWWLLHRRIRSGYGRPVRLGGSPHLLLLFLAVFMVSGPLIASSRGGFLVSVGMAIGVLVVLAASGGGHGRRGTLIVTLVLSAAAGLGVWLGWDRLSARLFPRRSVTETRMTAVQDFSLRCVFEVVPQTRGSLGGLVGLSDVSQIQYGRPGGAFLSVLRSGALQFGLFDATRKPRSFSVLPGFSSNYVGQTVEVVAVRQGTNGQVYVNGQWQPGPSKVPVRAADAPPNLPAAFLWVGSLAGGSTFYAGTISEVALFDRALTPAEVRRLAAPHEGGPDAGAPAGVSPPRPIVQLQPNRFDLNHWWSTVTADRQNIHRLAAGMVRGRESLLGAGPGTIPVLFQRHGPPLARLVDPHVHNDWLETRLTFGWLGFGLVFLALLTALVGPVAGGRWSGLHPLYWFLLIPIGGCLGHAWQDFPLQNPAVLLVFVLWISAASGLGGTAGTSAGPRPAGH